MRTKRPSEPSGSPLTSGWYYWASLRKATLISPWVALRATPSVP